MSVIQDALKRRLADQQQGKLSHGARAAGGAAPPPTPPIAEQVLRNEDAARLAATPIAEAPAAALAPHRGDGARWVFGTALVVLFAILVGGVLWYLKQGIPLVEVPAPSPASSSAVTGVPSSTALAPAGTAEPGTALAAASPVPPGESPQSAPPAYTTGTVAPLAPATGLQAVAAGTPGGEIPRAQWPPIRVDGVMAGSVAKKRSAILNGQMVFLNQKIEDVRLINVDENGVRLRYLGQEIDLEIGQVANDTDD